MNICFGVLKIVFFGGLFFLVGIKEKVESLYGLFFMVKEFVFVLIFNFCGFVILIDYISFNMVELIFLLLGVCLIKRMVNI